MRTKWSWLSGETISFDHLYGRFRICRRQRTLCRRVTTKSSPAEADPLEALSRKLEKKPEKPDFDDRTGSHLPQCVVARSKETEQLLSELCSASPVASPIARFGKGQEPCDEVGRVHATASTPQLTSLRALYASARAGLVSAVQALADTSPQLSHHEKEAFNAAAICVSGRTSSALTILNKLQKSPNTGTKLLSPFAYASLLFAAAKLRREGDMMIYLRQLRQSVKLSPVSTEVEDLLKEGYAIASQFYVDNHYVCPHSQGKLMKLFRKAKSDKAFSISLRNNVLEFTVRYGDLQNIRKDRWVQTVKMSMTRDMEAHHDVSILGIALGLVVEDSQLIEDCLPLLTDYEDIASQGTEGDFLPHVLRILQNPRNQPFAVKRNTMPWNDVQFLSRLLRIIQNMGSANIEISRNYRMLIVESFLKRACLSGDHSLVASTLSLLPQTRSFGTTHILAKYYAREADMTALRDILRLLPPDRGLAGYVLGEVLEVFLHRHNPEGVQLVLQTMRERQVKLKKWISDNLRAEFGTTNGWEMVAQAIA
ncbi:hypothetical protein BC832DRAFT_590167 [Gaertneriomyces semiglobifer]|nr:hypothetical protein BC832DRAFT_590167 [Gaertneriomyces semiglobifer]